MSIGAFYPQSVVDFNQRYEAAGWSAFRLMMYDRSFAYLYIGPEDCTLRWDSGIDFRTIDTEALERLPVAVLGIQENRKDLGFRFLPHVTLVVAMNEPSSDREDDLEELNLEIDRDYSQYLQILNEPDQVVFARYDFTNPQLNFSLMAENPRFVDPGGGVAQLAFRQLRSSRWVPGVINWILANHANAPLFSEIIDADLVGSVLSSLSESL